MPVRPLRPCRKVGCGKLHRDRSGYCDDHKDLAIGWTRPGRGSSSQRGYGTAWRKLRERILLRDKGLCQPCLVQGRVTAATEVDHIKPKAEGGTDDDANLQAICSACHRRKTQGESIRARAGG